MTSEVIVGNGGNGNVTLAVLATKLDNMASMLQRSCDRVEVDHDALTALLAEHATVKTRLTKVEGDVDRIDQRDKLWGGINSFAAVLAGVIGSMLGRP